MCITKPASWPKGTNMANIILKDFGDSPLNEQAHLEQDAVLEFYWTVINFNNCAYGTSLMLHYAWLLSSGLQLQLKSFFSAM